MYENTKLISTRGFLATFAFAVVCWVGACDRTSPPSQTSALSLELSAEEDDGGGGGGGGEEEGGETRLASSRMASISSSSPRTVEEIYKDFSNRRSALVRALTYDVDEFYSLCDPEKENLCLYGHSNESWEVAPPAEEVPPELPEPALGINFARDGMKRKDWLSLVAVHSDCWLLSVAFYFGARLNANDRKRLFSHINEIPTLFEVVTDRKPGKDKPNMDSGGKSRNITKRPSEALGRSTPKSYEDSYGEEEEDDDEHGDTQCGSCGGNYSANEFWIGCDICERWFHGKCVKITPAKAESIKQYKCPSCNSKRIRQ